MLKLNCREGSILYDKIDGITYNPAVVNLVHHEKGKFDMGPDIYRAHIERNDKGEPIVCSENKIAEITDLAREAWPDCTDFLEESLVLRLFVIDIRFSDKREPSRIGLIIGGDPKIPSCSAKAFIMNDEGKTIEILRNYWL